MKIGILGSGGVAQALGSGLLGLGHEVTLGTRDKAKLAEWLKKINSPKADVGSFAEAAAFGEIIFLTTHGVATIGAIDMAGRQNFAGKIVIDVTNPLDFSGGVPPKFAATLDNSLGEQIQKHLPQSKVVKAFNTIGAHIMIKAKRDEGTPDLFIAGNDAAAKQWIADLAQKWGWLSTIDLGGIENSYWLETFAMLWIVYGFKNNSWNHAFKLLKK